MVVYTCALYDKFGVYVPLNCDIIIFSRTELLVKTKQKDADQPAIVLKKPDRITIAAYLPPSLSRRSCVRPV